MEKWFFQKCIVGLVIRDEELLLFFLLHDIVIFNVECLLIKKIKFNNYRMKSVSSEYSHSLVASHLCEREQFTSLNNLKKHET